MDACLKKVLDTSAETYSFSGAGNNSVLVICEGAGHRDIVATVRFSSKRSDAEAWRERAFFLERLANRLLHPKRTTDPSPVSRFEISGFVVGGGYFQYGIRQKDVEKGFCQFATVLCQSKDELKFKELVQYAVGDFEYTLPSLIARRSAPRSGLNPNAYEI